MKLNKQEFKLNKRPMRSYIVKENHLARSFGKDRQTQPSLYLGGGGGGGGVNPTPHFQILKRKKTF